MHQLSFIMCVCLLGSASASRAQDAAGQPSSEANPVEFSVAAVRRGKQLFTVHCVRCHGVDGRGDTEMREFLKTAPADLSDDQWTYGGADGAVFRVIKHGASERDMPGFSAELDDERTWQVVHYIRYLGGQRP